jgi:O-antigen ligase
MSSILDRAIVIGMLLILVLTALAHGAVEPWSLLLMEVGICVLTLLWGIKAFVDGRFRLVIPPLIWPLVALTLLGVVQSIVWTDGEGNWRSLSFDVEATRATVIVLAFVIVFGLLGASVLADRVRQVGMLARFFAIYGLVLAFLAVLQYFTDVHTLLWLRTVEGGSFGSFVNRNHFAGYMEMLLPWAVVMVFARRRSSGEQFFYGFAAAWMGAATVISLSRGGMISILTEILLLGIFSRHLMRDSASSRPWSETPQPVEQPSMTGRLVRVGLLGAIVAAIVIGVFWLGAEPVINRITTGNADGSVTPPPANRQSAGRMDTWRDTWKMIRTNPIVGTGLGAYETAYPIYAKDDGTAGVVAQAHNDYLQVLADGGIVGGLIVLWFIVALCRAVYRGLQATDPFLVKAAVAGGVGLFGILVHSLFDFNLQLPSHALLFCLCSVVLAQLPASQTAPVAAEVAQRSSFRAMAESVPRP